MESVFFPSSTNHITIRKVPSPLTSPYTTRWSHELLHTTFVLPQSLLESLVSVEK